MKASLRKHMTSVRWLTLTLGAGATWLGVAGCSTTSTLVPQAPPKEVAVPAYAYLPHPGGYTSNDVRILFTDKSAPSPEAMAKCEADFRDLYSRVQSVDERTRGVRELVSRNPAAYHWCFYSRVLELEEGLSKDDFVDEKQKRVITAYEYLVPVARAFMLEFQDSRYVRWAIRDYRRLADLYFYRKVELSPQMSSVLVDVEVPVDAFQRPALQDATAASVIDKYKIGNSVPDSSILSTVQTKDQDNAKAAEIPPPAKEAPKAEGSDAEVQDTIEFAKELSDQRKEADANRSPAQAPSQELPPPPASTK